jgi:hypothetical protein
MIESIGIALEMLHDSEIRPGFKLKITQAEFQQKGNYHERKKVEIDKVTQIRIKAAMEK